MLEIIIRQCFGLDLHFPIYIIWISFFKSKKKLLNCDLDGLNDNNFEKNDLIDRLFSSNLVIEKLIINVNLLNE